jgi:hypothetical protein
MEIQLQYGLCNRLQTIIGFFTYRKGLPLHAIWIPDAECPGKFEECFEKIPNLEILESKTSECIGDFYMFPYEDFRLSKQSYTDNFIRNHRIIRPTFETRKYIKTLNLQNCVGIHIRRTDFLPHVKNYLPNIVSQIDNNYFHNLINNILATNSQQKIYLATDNYETQNMFFSLFPKNIIFRKILPKESKEKRHTSIKDATIDLFCLIECKEFYGTKESSFSTFVENYRKNKI